MLACQHGEISMVRELLEAGIDPNAVDNVSFCFLIDFSMTNRCVLTKYPYFFLINLKADNFIG